MVFPQLRTARLLLREIVPADEADIFEIFSSEQVMRYYDSAPMTERQEAAELIARFRQTWEEGSGCRWGITVHGSARIIGTCGLFNHNRAFFSATTGYEMAVAHWGNGYIREALAAVFKHAFEQLNINRLQAMTNLDNERSIASLARLGFREEGILRQWGFWKNQFHDVRCFSLLKGEQA